MEEILVNAFAKINWSIDVLGKLPNGYHQVLMVMQQIDLYDKVKIKWQEGPWEFEGEEDETTEVNPYEERSSQDPSKTEGIRINLSTSLPYLPTDAKNLAYKAAALMAETYKKGETGLVEIEIGKVIPVSGGLAGGSSNGAAVLHGLNKLWELGLTVSELMELGTKLGADVAFCIAGQAALNANLGLQKDPKAGTCAIASGIGEKLEIIQGMKAWFVLSKPPISVSTAKVYQGLDLQKIKERPNTEELVAGIRENNYHKIGKNMVNVLETFSLLEYPSIVYTKNKMLESGKPYKVLMSGSGPTVLGLFANKSKALTAYYRMKRINKDTFIAKTCTFHQ
ncbi:MAG: 4-(cytidine 5'-diphospho)-2-C-methyl-D-erythritol kinase [Anaerovoracaceae bacterium]